MSVFLFNHFPQLPFPYIFVFCHENVIKYLLTVYICIPLGDRLSSKWMKYSELHNLIKKNGWVFDHAKGSHYFYTKNGKLSEPIPFHGSKEIGEGLKNKLIKVLGLK